MIFWSSSSILRCFSSYLWQSQRKKSKDTAFPSHTSHVWMNMFWMKKLGFLPNPWAKDMTGNGWKLGWSHWLDSEAKMLWFERLALNLILIHLRGRQNGREMIGIFRSWVIILEFATAKRQSHPSPSLFQAPQWVKIKTKHALGP